MKRLSLLLALALAGGVASAQAATTTHHHAKSAKLKAIHAEGDVVSVDAAAKTATVKVNGEEMTHPVKGKAAAAELRKLKAGDHVRLTVMANASTGEHEYISSIRPAMASPAAAEKKPAPAKKKY
jgi:Cu/Ag efflux protein CusF